MSLYKFLKLGFLALLLAEPVAAMELEEENFGVNFKRLSPEIKEFVLSHGSLLTWSRLSQTSKAWHGMISPFLLIPSHHIDFEKHFSNRTTFKLEYSPLSFWVLAREYEKNRENSRLFVIKINTHDLHETVINLNTQLGWSGRVTEEPVTCTGSANPVCFAPCPHGGVFIYAPIDGDSNITFVSDSGIITNQSVLSNYNKSNYIDMTCGEEYIAMNSKYETSDPILFIPYHLNIDETIYYSLESETDKWPRFKKIPDRGHSVNSLKDKFLVEINNGVDEYSGMPNVERTLIIDPKGKGGMIEGKERDNFPISSADPIVEALIKETIFPQHYKILSQYSFIKRDNLLFLLGRLERPSSSKEDIYGVNEEYKGLNYRKESPYPYGIILIKNLNNFETISKKLLFDTTQLGDIQNEYMQWSGSYLFITTYFRKRSTPKLTAIDISPIKWLLPNRGIEGFQTR